MIKKWYKYNELKENPVVISGTAPSVWEEHTFYPTIGGIIYTTGKSIYEHPIFYYETTGEFTIISSGPDITKAVGDYDGIGGMIISGGSIVTGIESDDHDYISRGGIVTTGELKHRIEEVEYGDCESINSPTLDGGYTLSNATWERTSEQVYDGNYSWMFKNINPDSFAFLYLYDSLDTMHGLVTNTTYNIKISIYSTADTKTSFQFRFDEFYDGGWHINELEVSELNVWQTFSIVQTINANTTSINIAARMLPYETHSGTKVYIDNFSISKIGEIDLDFFASNNGQVTIGGEVTSDQLNYTNNNIGGVIVLSGGDIVTGVESDDHNYEGNGALTSSGIVSEQIECITEVAVDSLITEIEKTQGGDCESDTIPPSLDGDVTWTGTSFARSGLYSHNGSYSYEFKTSAGGYLVLSDTRNTSNMHGLIPGTTYNVNIWLYRDATPESWIYFEHYIPGTGWVEIYSYIFTDTTYEWIHMQFNWAIPSNATGAHIRLIVNGSPACNTYIDDFSIKNVNALYELEIERTGSGDAITSGGASLDAPEYIALAIGYTIISGTSDNQTEFTREAIGSTVVFGHATHHMQTNDDDFYIPIEPTQAITSGLANLNFEIARDGNGSLTTSGTTGDGSDMFEISRSGMPSIIEITDGGTLIESSYKFRYQPTGRFNHIEFGTCEDVYSPTLYNGVSWYYNAYWARTNDKRYTGNYSWCLNKTTGVGGGTGTIHLVASNDTEDLNGIIPGRKYKIDVWLYSTASTSSNARLVFYWYNSGWNILAAEPIPNSWYHYQEEVELPDTTTGVYIRIEINTNEQAGTKLYIDEFQITDISDNFSGICESTLDLLPEISPSSIYINSNNSINSFEIYSVGSGGSDIFGITPHHLEIENDFFVPIEPTSMITTTINVEPDTIDIVRYNFIEYGDCESTNSPTLDGGYSNAENATWTRSTDRVYEGTYSWELNKDSLPGAGSAIVYLTDNLNTSDMHGLEANTTYLLSVAMNSNASTPTNAKIYVLEYVAGWNMAATISSTIVNSWQYFSNIEFSIDPAATAISIQVYIATAEPLNTKLYIDKFSITSAAPKLIISGAADTEYET